MEARLKPLVKGTLSFILPGLRTTRQVGFDRTGPEYCYSVFLRHFSHVGRLTQGRVPARVAEFGPGASIGVGLAALLAGAERYVGLDILDSTDDALNLGLFDDLVDLFRARAPIPRSGSAAHIFTEATDWSFPNTLIPQLDAALKATRLEAIRRDITEKSGRHIRLAAPWTNAAVIPANSVDWILSQSVLEHVDDLATLYASTAAWLDRTGVMSHEIDYFCHDLTHHWNGHWSIKPRTWTLIRGRRPYLINRAPHARHMELLRQQGFEIVTEILNRSRSDGLPRSRFAAPFDRMSDSDAQTATAFVLAKRAG